MIIKFVLNSILNNVGMSWIIFYNNEILYESKENNHPGWFNKGPWYNTAICSKFHVKLFEYFIKRTITDRYHLICSIIAHDKQQPLYKDE